MKEKIKLIPIAKCGGGKTGELTTNYQDIVNNIFEPNVTELDDPDKVKASWGFKDEKGREAFLWCYKYYGNPQNCLQWSADGDKDLLIELFGDKINMD